MARHSLDIWPIPEDKSPLYINEPWLIDQSLLEATPTYKDIEELDNIRVYIPMDINRKAVLRRINSVLAKYMEATEENEDSFQMEIEAIIAQIEIYDQVWFARTVPEGLKHSRQALNLVQEVIALLREIPDGCSEGFPFDLIEALESEYI